MKVIVDTSVWSLALRRIKRDEDQPVKELKNLIHDYRVQMMGPIRQEILSGISNVSQFDTLKKQLISFPDLLILSEDYVRAASFYILCRSKGLQGSNTDFLICAVAIRNKFSVFSTDRDFKRFSDFIPLHLHQPV